MMEFATVFSILLAALSVGHDQNYTAIYDEFLSGCPFDQVIQLFIGNFSNECTRMPSIKVDGQPGTKTHVYLTSVGYIHSQIEQPANVVCVTIDIEYFDWYRIHTLTITRKNSTTGALTTTSSRRLAFQPLIYNQNHTVVIVAGSCRSDIRAIAINNENVYAGVVCRVLPEEPEDDYAFVATKAKHPSNATLVGYEHAVDQIVGQPVSYIINSQSDCP